MSRGDKIIILKIYALLLVISVSNEIFAESILPLPTKSASVEVVDRTIREISVTDKNLILLTDSMKDFFIVRPYSKNKTGITFAKIADSKRVKFKKIQFKNITSIIVEGLQNLFFDSQRFSFTSFERSNYKCDKKSDIYCVNISESKKTKIAWDGIRPTKDRLGEAPAFEINALRAKFKKTLYKYRKGFWAKTNINPAFVGLTKLKFTKNSREYLLVTRLKDFPLMKVSCNGSEFLNCKIKRKCNVFGARNINNIVTVGFDNSSKTIILGNNKQNSLLYYKYNSCSSTKFIKEKKLPKRLKSISSLFIDTDSRLWISTIKPDDYFNASVFYWNKNDWGL